MRFGVFANPEDAALMRDVGFDYIELHIREHLRPSESSAAWAKTGDTLKSMALPAEAAACLLPETMPVIGPQRDMTALQNYMQRAAKRAQQLGIQRLVFGSGPARVRPAHFDVEQTMTQLTEFTRMAGQMCAHHGVTLVIEHLNQSETNTLNRLSQAHDLYARVDHPNVAMMVDSYHYGLERENEYAIIALGNTIRHVHVAEPDRNRYEPGAYLETDRADQSFDFETFFCWLRKVGYDERITIECNWSGPISQCAQKSLAYLRKCWDVAGRCESLPPDASTPQTSPPHASPPQASQHPSNL